MRKISIIGSGSWAQALTKVFVKREILVKYRKIIFITIFVLSNRSS